jgi:hypothetical protein
MSCLVAIHYTTKAFSFLSVSIWGLGLVQYEMALNDDRDSSVKRP